MRRVPPSLLPLVLLPLILPVFGCASMKARPTDVPSPATAATGSGSMVPMDPVDAALLTARARQAAGEQALKRGDTLQAREEFEAALRAIQSVGPDLRLAEISADLAAELRALPGEPASGDEPLEADNDEAEPSPLDDLAVTAPQLSPGQIDQERALIELGEPRFDIPMVVNDRVVAWVDFYTNRHRDKFRQGLQRSGRYLSMIHRIFTEEGLPKDLAYMAHVESAYKPNAYSRAKAKGIFQFISATGRRYGLRIDKWIDERSDPEKATRAAAAYLKDLYAMFGDWYLALAAYNAGEGKIQRVLDRTGAPDFWSLAKKGVLRNETINYVPAILAATLISRDPGRYGFEFEPDPPLAYETVPIRGAVDLKVLARCAGTSYEALKDLNPALRRRQTPPGRTTDVRVPVGTGTTALAALSGVPETDRALAAHHVVRKGDTLSRIAKRYGVSTGSIQRANGLDKRSVIHPGTDLVIPGGDEAYVAESAPEPATRHRDSHGRYTVRAGDTLARIARQHGTTPRAIASASGIGVNGTLRIGQRLTLPGHSGVAEAQRSASSRRASVHTVRRGDTLKRIAERYRVSVDEICTVNAISQEQTIYPGTRLTIPGN